MVISKTTFLEFQMCPKNTWQKRHRPELVHQFFEFELPLVEQLTRSRRSRAIFGQAV